ncbi:MAG TPA: pyridoxal phosphate-dependent aminotransferase [Candidatus Polarisedimenticolaceae bacterium]
MFSRRIPSDLEPNALARAREAAGPGVLDLTISNPTACGLDDDAGLLASLADPRGARYAPHPLGLRSAREAIAATYAERGVAVEPGRIVLTASSSEAYGFLFRTLCDADDAVLVPIPSYPLFEHLAALDAVRAVPWPLDPHADWRPRLDPDAARRERARAVVVVHPNNPTGSAVCAEAADALARGCADAGLALVVDEVFLDYPLAEGERFDTFAARNRALTFTLGGLSKSVGLPQLKLGWIVVGGPPPLADEAVRRLEFVADSYLSVGTPVQWALSTLLREGRRRREAILARCRRNLAALAMACVGTPVSLERPAGGWSAVLRYPAVEDEEAFALGLLERARVAVQPGYFFDFPGRGRIVVSLLTPEADFDEGITRLLREVEP